MSNTALTSLFRKPSNPPTRLVGLALLIFFVTTYSLFYSGTFITDDEHVLAARSLSFAFDDQFNLSRVLGNRRVYDFALYGPIGVIEAANVEPAQAVLGAILAKISVQLGIGRIQTMFLLNIWVTAITAVIIFFTASKMGNTKQLGIILAFFFGLCTIALPYSRTYFRDPLAMLFLAAAWLFFHQIMQPTAADTKAKQSSRGFLWFGFSGCLIAGVLSKNTVAIAIPVFLIELIVSFFSIKKLQFSKSFWIKAGIITLLVLGVGFIWFLLAPQIPVLARFSPAYYASLFRFFASEPKLNFFQALVGPFLSPGKSIFFFSPVLIFSLWGLIFHFRKSWSAWLYLLLLIIFQALFYDDEWAGHINWGLRYILPAIPALVLASAPVINDLVKDKRGRISIILIAIISFIIQLLGSLPPTTQYFVEKFSSIPTITEYSTIWNIKQSIILWSSTWIINGKGLDLAIVRNPETMWLMIPTIFVLAIIIFLSYKVQKPRWYLIISVLIAIGLQIGMLMFYRNDPAYLYYRIDLTQSQDFVLKNAQQQDLIYIYSYGTPVWYYWMNWSDNRIQWTSLPYYFPNPSSIENYNHTHIPEDAMDKNTLNIFENEIEPGRRVWIISPWDSPGADLELDIQWLKERSFENQCQKFHFDSHATQVCFFHIK